MMEFELCCDSYDAALIAAALDLLAAAIKVNALSIQSDAHKELRAAIAKALDHEA